MKLKIFMYMSATVALIVTATVWWGWVGLLHSTLLTLATGMWCIGSMLLPEEEGGEDSD